MQITSHQRQHSDVRTNPTTCRKKRRLNRNSCTDMNDHLFQLDRMTKAQDRKKKTEPTKLRRILVPIDFSAAAQKALRYAANLAQQHQSNIFLLHVVAASAPENANTAVNAANKNLADLRKAQQLLPKHCKR